MFLLFVAYDILISVGYCPMSAPLLVLYSKVLGPRRQGTMQGLVLQVGSFARTVGPIFVTQIFTSYGPIATWIMEIVLITLAIVFVCVGYTHLVPLATLADMKSGDKCRHKKGVVYRF